MITSLDIAPRVYQLLTSGPVIGIITGSVDYYRTDYTKEDIIIIPRTTTGEDSVRFGQINVNIHVPDTQNDNQQFYPDLERLQLIQKEVLKALKRHYESGEGWNWAIGQIDPPYQEKELNEHFISIKLELTVRNQ
ncbi:MAG: hypothetical protein AB2L20_11945 [Mangrovibacterium sp.]